VRHGRPGARPRWWTAIALALCAATSSGAAAPAPAAQARASLEQDLDRLLAAPPLERATWGIAIRSLAAGDTLYARNPRKLLMPASTLKLVTLAAAVERLGWDFSYETRLVADGSLRGDTIEGNLVVVASGDPSLDARTLDQWAARLRGLGVARVTGTVLADTRLFTGPELGAGWSWDDLPYYYAAPIGAAQFRENAVDLTLRPGAVPPSVEYDLVPARISGLIVDNRLRLGPRGQPPVVVARRAPGSSTVVLEGALPAGSAPIVRSLSVPNPTRYLAAALVDALAAAGITVGAPPPADAAADATRDWSAAPTLVTHRSAPLRILARRMMEVSQNLYAETLLKTMGAQAGDGTFDRGLKVEEEVLASWGIPPDAVVLRDGSGLSRYNAVTADALVDVLAQMYRDPRHRAAYFSLLNGAGEDGTLANRMRTTKAAGRVRAKDGAMAGVRALCGIVTTAGGEPLAFAIIANHFGAGAPVTPAIDAMVTRLAELER